MITVYSQISLRLWRMHLIWILQLHINRRQVYFMVKFCNNTIRFY